MQFEEAFDIEIPDEDAEKIKTVKGCCRVTSRSMRKIRKAAK